MLKLGTKCQAIRTNEPKKKKTSYIFISDIILGLLLKMIKEMNCIFAFTFRLNTVIQKQSVDFSEMHMA